MYCSLNVKRNRFVKSRSCGAQPARLYGLAKVHKQVIPLRPILSLPGFCYENLAQSLSKWLEQLPGANIENSTAKVKEAVVNVELEEDEVFLSLDVQSLYTNVPVSESIQLAADILFRQDRVPEFEKATFIELMNLAVRNVMILHNDT